MKARAANVAKGRAKSVRAASKAANAGKKLRKTSKAPVSAAKARYKELSGRARRSNPLRTAAENRNAAGAKRSLATMIKKRGR